MPIPVIIFLVGFTLIMLALPIVALRAYRGGALPDKALALSWAPLIAWVVAPLVAMLSGQAPPSRGTAWEITVILLLGLAAAVAVALAKGAPRATKAIAWVCVAGLLANAGFAAVAAAVLLPA